MFVITKLGYQDLGCIILSIEIHLSLEDKNTSTVAVGVSGCDVVVMPPATTNTNSSPYFYKTIVVVLVLIANAIIHNKYFFYQIEMICIFTFVRNGMRILGNILLINSVHLAKYRYSSNLLSYFSTKQMQYWLRIWCRCGYYYCLPKYVYKWIYYPPIRWF